MVSACAVRRAFHYFTKINADGLALDLRANSDNTRVVDLSFARYSTLEWQVIFDALKANRNCEELICQDSGLRDAQIILLAEVLKCHPTLAVLKLNMNDRLGDCSAEHLAQALRENAVLRVLCLPHTSIGDEGAARFASVLPVNHALEEILLDGTLVTDRGAQSLKDAVARNCPLTKLKLSHFDAVTCRILGVRPPRVSSEKLAELDGAVRQKPTNLKSSHFNAKYAMPWRPYANVDELYAGLRKIIMGYIAHADLGMVAGILPAVSEAFADRLIDSLRQSGESNIPKLAVKAWTSHEEQDKLTFYGIIQDCLRKDIAGPLMQPIAQYCHTLNQFVVVRKTKSAPWPTPAAPWPTQTERGAWLPRSEIEWFKSMEQKLYRYPGYLASSSLDGTASSFLSSFGSTKGDVLPVKFYFHFQPRGCRHVNYLEHLTMVPNECEWLFQHYSCFKVRSVADIHGGPSTAASPVEIHLEVQVDNMDEDPTLSLAKWH